VVISFGERVGIAMLKNEKVFCKNCWCSAQLPVGASARIALYSLRRLSFNSWRLSYRTKPFSVTLRVATWRSHYWHAYVIDMHNAASLQ
jgi:hypothetical protein